MNLHENPQSTQTLQFQFDKSRSDRNKTEIYF